MGIYALESVFRPHSLALVGGSPRERSLGRTILQNLQAAGFAGPIGVVNPKHAQIAGIASVPRFSKLLFKPELVIVAVSPNKVPTAIADAAAAGARAAIIVTTGLGRGAGSLLEKTLRIARKHGVRIVGPNCLGVMAPHARLNASFSAGPALPGDLALISQSGSIASGLVEWARSRGVGLSAAVSLGDAGDVDAGDLLDWFAQDGKTRAILMYIESIGDARKFMSAARAAARAKPVIVVKSGRHTHGARAAATHTGALAGSDAVHDAAFRRAGLLRVLALDELFSAVETLGHLRTTQGRRLAILTNGGGMGVLATDRLIDMGGTLATLDAATRQQLDALLPCGWSQANPVDALGDADAERYAAVLAQLLASPENDAVLAMHASTALSSSQATAEAVAELLEKRPRSLHSKPVLGVWLGADDTSIARLGKAGVPTYASEADAVRGYMYLVRHHEAQQALMETPPSLPEDFEVDAAAARMVVEQALAQGRQWLDPLEVAEVLKAYGIPITPVVLAKDPEHAVLAAADWLEQGMAVALKVLSPEIVHKSDVDGVRLNLTTATAVKKAAKSIIERARTLRPDARIEGVTVQPMVIKPKARELIAGLADDPTFGPVVVFGRGGTAVEVIDDKALALPPLDLRLAHELIGRTRVSRILKAYRDVPAADEHAVALILVKLAQLAADIPQIRELDINPLLADRDGVVAVDARITIAACDDVPNKGPWHSRMVIRPYPSEWERMVDLAQDNERMFVRPVRPEDEAMFLNFFEKISNDDLRLRFFSTVRHFSHEFIARLTQLDYARSIALVGLGTDSGELLGVVHLLADANFERGEYSILVRSDLKGYGIGWKLMQMMIEYARSVGLKAIEGQVLRENTTMLRMCKHLGFAVSVDPDDMTVMQVALDL